MFEKVMDILENDLEAFTRRAAVELLKRWSSSGAMSDKAHHIFTTMKRLIDDYDWEVKIKAIEFWEEFIKLDKVTIRANGSRETSGKSLSVHGCSNELLEHFCMQGGNEVLFKAIKDHDRSVQKKACQVMLKIYHFLAREKENETHLPAVCLDLSNILSELDLEHLMQKFDSSIDEHTDMKTFLYDVLSSMKLLEESLPAEEDDGTAPSIDCY